MRSHKPRRYQTSDKVALRFPPQFQAIAIPIPTSELLNPHTLFPPFTYIIISIFIWYSPYFIFKVHFRFMYIGIAFGDLRFRDMGLSQKWTKLYFTFWRHFPFFL